MSIRRTPWGGYQARLIIDGRQYSATLPTREVARDWERLLRAQSVTGSLPRRVAVRDYAAQWIAGYDAAPANTGGSTKSTSSTSSRGSGRRA